MNKRIAFIIPNWPTKMIGGAELQSHQLARLFLDSGWCVTVYTAYGTTHNPEFDLEGIRFSYYSRKILGSYSFGATVLFFKLCLRNPKNIYLRTDARVEMAALTLYKSLFGCLIQYALAADGDAQFKPTKRGQSARGARRLVLKWDAYLLDRIAYKGFMTFPKIVQNASQLEQVKNRHRAGTPVRMIQNSYNGPILNDGDFFKKKRIILWVGNFREVKRPEKFIQLASICQNSDWMFVMIGKTDSYDLSDLPDNLQVLGPQPRSVIFEWMSKAMLLVNTSISEGFSNTFLEAWGHMTYVLTLGVNPNGVFSELGHGIVCKDIDALKASVMKVDGEELLPKVRKAKQHLFEQNNLHKNFSDLKAVYQSSTST